MGGVRRRCGGNRRRWRRRELGSLQGLTAAMSASPTAMQATGALLSALRCLAARLLSRAEHRPRGYCCGADVLYLTIRVTGCKACYPPQGLPRAEMGLHVAEVPSPAAVSRFVDCFLS